MLSEAVRAHRTGPFQYRALFLTCFGTVGAGALASQSLFLRRRRPSLRDDGALLVCGVCQIPPRPWFVRSELFFVGEGVAQCTGYDARLLSAGRLRAILTIIHTSAAQVVPVLGRGVSRDGPGGSGVRVPSPAGAGTWSAPCLHGARRHQSGGLWQQRGAFPVPWHPQRWALHAIAAPGGREL